MSARSVARRYAAALFDVTRKAGREVRAGEDLAEIARTISGHAELGHVLGSPTVPINVKRTVVSALLDAAGASSDEVRRMMMMLTDRDRLAVLPDLSAAFAERLLEAQNIIRADVASAAPLSAESRTALADALSRATGKTVRMTERVEPALVGGVVARVGTFVYDGSILRQLERIREKLTVQN